MSGNSVAIGIGLGQADWWRFLERLWPVVLYVLGILCGRSMIEVAARREFQRIATVAFVLEIALLVCTLIASGSQVASVALLAFAMGLQNAVLTRFSSLTVHTGFVTGGLLRMTEEFVRYIFWFFDGAPAGRPGKKSGSNAMALLFVWAFYVAGAVAGTMLLAQYGLRALFLPMLVLVFLIGWDILSPLAIAEEKAEFSPQPG